MIVMLLVALPREGHQPNLFIHLVRNKTVVPPSVSPDEKLKHGMKLAGTGGNNGRIVAIAGINRL
ncbi:MAG: hypothetical protein C5S47_04860 [Candidatus Methanogasteraceae archaeon]|nr:MAG: hypothetical protein C5S47_04860 [ANME-2 cluster archaeon]